MWYQKDVGHQHHLQVHYCGTLDDDSVFDSSHEREPLEFIVGTGKVIPGFDNVVIGIVKGERRKERVTPDMAYGKRMHLVQYLSNHCVVHKHSRAANLFTQPANTWSLADKKVLGILDVMHVMCLLRSGRQLHLKLYSILLSKGNFDLKMTCMGLCAAPHAYSGNSDVLRAGTALCTHTPLLSPNPLVEGRAEYIQDAHIAAVTTVVQKRCFS